MEGKLTYTAPKWMAETLYTYGDVTNINSVIDRITDDQGMDFGLIASWGKYSREVVFEVIDCRPIDMPAALKLIDGLLFEEFDVDFE